MNISEAERPHQTPDNAYDRIQLGSVKKTTVKEEVNKRAAARAAIYYISQQRNSVE